jgi:mRNA interferase MazF
MLCEQGEVIYVDFEPHRGHEPAKYRPALVLSASDFNNGASMTVLCPITSSDTGYPFHVYIDSGQVVGYACIEQMRALDLEARRCKRAGWADAEGMGRALEAVGAVFGI